MSARIHGQIKMSEVKIRNAVDLINLFFEYFVFYRWIYFKNRPRGNLFLIRALLLVGAFAGIYFSVFSSFELVIEGVEIDSTIAFGAFVIVGYWNMSNVFHKKSEYCFHLYNEILREFSGNDKKRLSILTNSLAQTLLTLDLWAHRAFSNLFARAMEEAIEFGGGDESSKTEIYDRINAGKMHLGEARELLDAYQQHLLG